MMRITKNCTVTCSHDGYVHVYDTEKEELQLFVIPNPFHREIYTEGRFKNTSCCIKYEMQGLFILPFELVIRDDAGKIIVKADI